VVGGPKSGESKGRAFEVVHSPSSRIGNSTVVEMMHCPAIYMHHQDTHAAGGRNENTTAYVRI